MNLKAFLTAFIKDSLTEREIFISRHKDYAYDDDIFDNTKRMAHICQLLGIDVTYQDIEWIYMIGKLVRERKVHNPDNFRDAHNYLRRIEAIRRSKG